MAYRNFHRREDDADWIPGVLGVLMDGASRSVALPQVDSRDGSLRPSCDEEHLSLIGVDRIPGRKVFLGWVALFKFVFLASFCFAQTQTNLKQDESLRRFLQDYLAESHSDDREPTRYSFAFVDLRDDGTKEVIVHVTGSSWCGTGGCRTLVLTPRGSSYRVIAQVTITRPPVRVLAAKSNGWHDIGVWVQGWRIQPGYEAGLRFDGKTYPSNPSVPPAIRTAKKTAGAVVIPATEEGSPIY